MSEKIDIDLDPKKVTDAMSDIAAEVKKLSEKIDSALGKEAPKSIAKFEDAAERGTNKISTFFRNMGTRMKEDLKTAFDVGKLLAGIKIGESFAAGTHQILDMERAFDRLNTRLKLTSRQMTDFKKQVGSRVSATGQKLEDVLPGVETASAKGGINSPEQLSSIAESLAKAKATTGEDTSALSETIVEILKSQGQKITGASFKQTLDALQSTRVHGAFGTAGEAGHAIESMAPYAKKMGLGTRELGGLAAAASRSGASGQDILRQLMEKGSSIGGQEQLNAVFGTQLFKKGKLDAGAFQNINKDRYGKYSQQVLGEASGMTGASGGDLSRFIDSMKEGMGDFNKVAQGANETADQFQTATDNLASKIDRFKEGAKESGREIGESFALLGKDIVEGHLGAIMGDIKGVGKTAYENKGTLMSAAGLAGMGALLAGSGANKLLSKLPGIGGMLGGIAGGEAAKAAGIQPVYVTNASEIGGGGLGKDIAGGLLGTVTKLGKFAGGAAGVLGAGAAGYGAGTLVNDQIDKMTGGNGIGGMLYDALHPDEAQPTSAVAASTQITPEDIKTAVRDGTVEAHQKTKGKVAYTVPGKMEGAGSPQGGPH